MKVRDLIALPDEMNQGADSLLMAEEAWGSEWDIARVLRPSTLRTDDIAIT